MPKNPSTQSELREKLIGSIWLLGDKYPYSFAPDGSCQIINHSRCGNYTISPDGRIVFLTWTTPSYTEELRVLEDGSLFMSGGILVAVDKSGDRYFPCYPLPQPDIYARFEIDTGKMPNYGNITLEGLQVKLISTDFGENFLSEEVREFQTQEEAEEYYYSTIKSNDPYYSPHSIGEPVYMELSNDSSHKFYEVTVEGFTLKICYGRIGNAGKTDHTTYKTPRQVQAAAVKKINEKLKKGYVILPQPGQHPSRPSKSSSSIQSAKKTSQPDSIPYWLPEDFRVFTNYLGLVSIYPIEEQGVEERILPTVNEYTGADGGYVAFYSRNPAKAVYSVGGGIYVVGQIRLKGRYIGRIFHPEGYENQDISAVPEFKALCRQTFGVEGWAGGDTGGWFANVNHQREAIQRNDIVQKIPYSTTPGLLLTVKPEDIIWWSIVKFRPGSTVEIVAISLGSCFSFNLMAGENFAYHFNPRSHEGQIVQNTKVENWGQEERLPFLQEMAFGQKFTLKIVVQETQLAVYLNDTFLSHYRHRIQPAEIDSLRLICTQGSLQIFSVNISEPEANNTPPKSDLDITQFIRPAWKPIVTQGDGDVLASKFSGRPWLAKDETWPTCPNCGKPMQLFLQLNLSELPELVRDEFGTGLLQMFHCIPGDCKPEYEEGTIYYGRVPFLMQNVRIRLVQPLGSGSTPPLPEIDGEEYGSGFPALNITNWVEIEDYPHPDDLVAQVYGWDQVTNYNLGSELAQRLGLSDEYDQVYPTDEGDKLAGYPRWVQDMEYPGCPICHAPMRLVFQLASCENLPYMFGDIGIAHILQCKTHKDQFAFVWSGC